MGDEPELIRQQMEETREQLAEKVSLLEQQVTGAVKTVGAVCDVPGQVQKNPWLAMGVAVAAGYVAGRWLTPSPGAQRRPVRMAHSTAVDGVALPASSSMWTELTQFAGSAFRGAAYELSARAVPLAIDLLLQAGREPSPPPEAKPPAADVLPFEQRRVE